MRYYIDSEFIDDGHTIGLISIGLVSEDGREYYTQSVDYDPAKASKWVKENVFPHLTVCPYTITDQYLSGEMALDYVGTALKYHKHGQCVDQIYGRRHRCPYRSREAMQSEILAFMDVEKYGKPELIGWCASYDFVALCQLFGSMMGLPSGWPHYIKDLQHVLDDRSWTDDMLPEQEGSAHNALCDAKHIRRLWTFLEEWHQHGVKV